MKRWGLLVSIVACALGGAACGDDSNNKGHLADAPTVSDAPTDAIGELAPVTVVVTVDGDPRKDVQVLFQNADSSLVASTKTGDDGKASAVMAAGGYATVIEPIVGLEGSGNLGPDQLATFDGVKPGDVLHDDLRPLGTESTTIQVTFQATDEQNGNQYVAYTTCSDASGVVLNPPEATVQAPTKTKTKAVASARANAAEVPLVIRNVSLTNCNGTADILIVSRNNEGITGWQYKSAVALTNGGTVTLDGTYTAATNVTFNYTKLPDYVSGLNITRDLYTARGTLFTTNTQVGAEGSSASTAMTLPMPDGVSALTTSITNPSNSGYPGQQTVAEWGPQTATYDLAYGDLALSQYTSVPVADVASHSLTWSVAANVDADFVIARFHDFRTAMDGGSHEWSWRIAAPYTAGKLAYPVLPSAVYAYNFAASGQGSTDNIDIRRLTTVKVPGGYDVARPYAVETSIFNVDAATPPIQLGAAGKTIFQDVFNAFGVKATTPAPTPSAQVNPKTAAAAATKRLSPASH